MLRARSYHSLIIQLFVLLSLLWAPVAAQEEIKVKIGSSGRGEVRFGVEPFRLISPSDQIEQYQKIAYSVLLWDLRFSLRFDVEELSEDLMYRTYADVSKLETERAKFWIDRAVDVFLRGEISRDNQEYRIKVSLAGPSGGQPILEKSYSARRSNYREVIHGISDDVIFAMSGEHGISRTKIAFISKRTGNKELFLAECDGFNEKRLTGNRSINLSPDWSPFGDEIIFTSFVDGNPDLFIFNLNTSSTRKYISYPGINSAPAWSPDGKEIAVTLSKDGNPEIYVVEFYTGKIRRLTHSIGIDTSPTWSPTGREIAFTSDRAGTPAIYVMSKDGSNVRRISFVGNYNASPSWSPLGDRIAFVGRSIDEGNTDLYVIDVTTGEVMRISAIGDNVDPEWSPDGYHVAFASNRDGSYDIYTITWDGADLHRITYSGQNYSPAWSPILIK